MTFPKTGLSRAFLVAGLLMASSAPLMAATPTEKSEHPVTTEKSAPAAPAKATPDSPASKALPTKGPAVTERKGRGSF